MPDLIPIFNSGNLHESSYGASFKSALALTIEDAAPPAMAHKLAYKDRRKNISAARLQVSGLRKCVPQTLWETLGTSLRGMLLRTSRVHVAM